MDAPMIQTVQSVSRRTKIVATLGPASDSDLVLEQLVKAGVDVARLNLAYGPPEEHRRRVERIRALAARHKRAVAVLTDLQGSKIRVGYFREESVVLESGAQFILDADRDMSTGDQQGVGINSKTLPRDCAPGDLLLVDDGSISLSVTGVESTRVTCRVVNGGRLVGNKRINRQGGGLSATPLGERDRENIDLAVELKTDWLAVPCSVGSTVIKRIREQVRAAGGKAMILVRIERAEVARNEALLDEILQACDAVMVVRGELGIELGDAPLVGIQKRIIARARSLNRPVITATQMMESMTTNSLPTRAEVFDVANAVLDGTDAVLLAGETAVGKHPARVVSAAARICCGSEKYLTQSLLFEPVSSHVKATDALIALTTMYTASLCKQITAIICLTESGNTALCMSRMNASLPIFALTRSEETCRKIALYRGVTGLLFDPTRIQQTRGDSAVDREAMAHLREAGWIREGDPVLLTKGDTMAVIGQTNTMAVLTVPSPDQDDGDQAGLADQADQAEWTSGSGEVRAGGE